MNINNMFSFSKNSLTCTNCIVHIIEHEFNLSILSINCIDNTYNLYCDEWLYLINYNYPRAGYYNFFVNHYNRVISYINENDIIVYNKNVISFITTFSRGSVHGFSGFWYTLITYINNIDMYKDLDIIVYKDSDDGILSILKYLSSIGIIKNEVILLEKNVKYKFDFITYIENHYHVFNGELEYIVSDFIDKYIIDKNLYQEKIICILKSEKSLTNITNNGILTDSCVSEFCNKYNISRIFPSDEIQLINSINKCKILILNYGSTFFKNYVYISDLCEKIIVIVKGDCYIRDYIHLSNIVPSKYRVNTKELYTKNTRMQK